MLLTLSTTASTTLPQATDLGYLLHKHPDKAQTFDTAAGTAHVFWPEATDERSTVALLLEVDPVALVRGKGRRERGFSLAQYVNDRPYAASSMLSVALGKVFRTALTGRCDARPDLAETPLPLEVRIPALPSRGGPDLVERLFAPLGWTVTATPIPLDPEIPAWGDSRYVDATLTGDVVLADALAHLYVLIPVLDDSKHYFVAQDEVDKLMRTAGPWLSTHPERELITRRYLGTDASSCRARSDDSPRWMTPCRSSWTTRSRTRPRTARLHWLNYAPARCWPRFGPRARAASSTSAAGTASCCAS